MLSFRKYCVLLSLLTGCAHANLPRSSALFNDSWKFARFGTMPDGSENFEPGGVVPNFFTSASSEAMEQDGEVAHIIDGDLNTYWNSAAKKHEWVAVNFRAKHSVSGVWIKWGFAGAPGITVDIKPNGKKWKLISDLKNNRKEGEIRIDFPNPVETYGIKINLVKMPKHGWPRIGELIIYDAAGKPIKFDMRKDSRPVPSVTNFDDTSWEKLNLPHDWAIKGPFNINLDHATALLPWRGIGWYRKSFSIPESDKNKCIYLDFDGAMANSSVYLNGKYVGGWPYGYNSFRIDLTPYLKFGKENTLAVRLDTEHLGSRWYPGAGIYRNVWLVKTSKVHIAHWGVSLTTPEVSKEKAVANFAVTVDNDSETKCKVDISGELTSPDGKKIRTDIAAGSLLPGKSKTFKLSADIADPELWDIATPNLYKTEIVVSSNGKILDKYCLNTGLRSIKFTPRDGFYLNGRRVNIKGVCNHHDLGPLGAAVNTRAIERQLEILKEMGCNAVRTSHNPPTPELLDLCDKMGFLVMDEAFDCWKRGKRPFDYSVLFDKWHRKDLTAMVKRDRNHPSIIMWSIGNEVPDQHNAKMAKMLRDIIHNIDPTRPVCLGSNNGGVGLSPVAQAVDIMGYNYNLGVYKKYFNRKENVETPMIASETSSCVTSRGEYFFPYPTKRHMNFQVTSYDIDNPGWGCDPDTQFKKLEEFPAVLGEFVWTGFDYLGEPTPYNRDVTNLLNFTDPKKIAEMKKELEKLGKIKPPSRSSYFGIIDLVGLKKDRFYIYQAHWRPDFPMAHILPHWNWPERIGKVTPVHVYTSGDEAELFLNGKSLGRKKKGKYEYRLRWDDVVYQPGTLKVVAYKSGKVWAEDTVKTTGKAAKIAMSPDRRAMKADGKDMLFITVSVEDKDGLVVPRSHNLIHFTVDGPAEIVAIGNGDSTSHESFQGNQHRVFNGKSVIYLRSIPGKKGKVTISAESDGLKSAEIELDAF